MKLLQAIAGAEFGGAESFFTRLAVALKKANVEQKVLLRKNDQRSSIIQNAGIEFEELPFGGALDWTTKHQIKLHLNRFKPDILLTWMNRATKHCSGIKSKKSVHVARLGGYYDLKYYQQCDQLICNTQGIASYLKGNGWPAEKVQYLPNFVDLDEDGILKRKEFYTPENAPLVLAMGRLHENKGFDVLLKALAHVPGTYLWLAGEGPLRLELESLAEKLGIKPRVRFLGWYDNVSALLRVADLFVCPSRHEPLGNVVLEAWAHEVPVVATDSEGPGELIDHLQSGILVPIDNAVLLSKAIRNLLADQRLADKIVHNGKEMYENSYTESIVVSKYIDFFQRILKECAESAV